MNQEVACVILPSISNPFLNQAVEEVLLQSVKNREHDLILRFWRSKPSVIIGRNQSLKAEVNIRACKKHQVPILRRITGGGGVYLDLGCLNFSFFMNNHCEYYSNNVSILNKFLITIIIDALMKSHLDCSFHVPNSIYLNNKKISGSAQLFRGNSVLHHGTLLINSDLDLLTKVLDTTLDTEVGHYVPSNRTKTTNIRSFNRYITIERIIQDIISQVEKAFHLELTRIDLTNEELNRARKLVREKYSSSKWGNKIP